ncbi:MAG: hypothetical protein BWK76_12010 [Desulfobulbaceae bacterium A2]|nr:MAG: hypothetical protein BWK76_12010 [Desulfobulbaceae bacterium A2]
MGTRKSVLKTRVPPRADPQQEPAELLHELHVFQSELEAQNAELRRAQLALEESRDRYHDLYDFSPLGYLSLTREGLIAGINLTGATLLGQERSRLLHRRFDRWVMLADRARWGGFVAAAWQQPDPGRVGCELLLKNGDQSCWHAELHCHARAGDRVPPLLYVTLNDISRRRQMEEQLRVAAIAFESQEGMIVTDAAATILRVNQAFTRLTGYSAEEAVGATPRLLRSGRHDTAFYRTMWETLHRELCWQGEIWNRRKDGKVYAEWLTISAVTDPQGTITHYVGAFTDITMSSEAEAEIHRLAFYDPLTQLPNRRLLLDRLGQSLASSARNNRHGAVLFIDLDTFKTLNDTRGHGVGDLLLMEVARRLQDSVREGDTVARLGGDEFVVILEDLDENVGQAATQVKAIGDKIVAAISSPSLLAGGEYHGTCSVGARLFFGHRASVDDLLKQADLAMYQAKSGGRNAMRFFDPVMHARIEERSHLEHDLRRALAEGQLSLHYQPQIADDGRILGVEALLRWRHPERGLVSPGVFIPLAEESRLILPIGHWVLDQACRQLKSWEGDPRTSSLKMSVNVSARQFGQSGFTEVVSSVLARTGASPRLLTLELTESLVLRDIEDSITKMRAMRAQGLEFSLDDFGTGYSSLAYLKRLPFQQLKIDQSFVQEMTHDADGAAIVRAILALGQALRLEVIAEGVEEEEQRAFLAQLGCVAFQGYLFSRPLPLAELEQFLRDNA